MDRKVSIRRRRYRKRWTEKCKDYFRSFLAFMFSNVGIIGLVIGYTIAGAFIFKQIEEDWSQKLKDRVDKERYVTAEIMWNITNKTNTFNETFWKVSVGSELLRYQQFMVQSIKSGTVGPAANQRWEFSSAFLYALTVITTIGYGNTVCRKREGKVVTIIYAIIGMPLFLLYLSNIGDIMAKSFKWLYAKLCLCRCCPGVARKRAERQRRRAEEASVQYFSNRDGSESPEVSIRHESFQGQHRVTYRSDYDDQDDGNGENDSVTVTEVSDDQAVTVPVTVCLCIMVGYILGGAILFSHYEERWSVLDGFYFCFISLSTIGFGDFVPGETMTSEEDGTFDVKAIIGSMYLMLGMALIAMCFNLMQEEVITKIRRTIRAIKYVFRCNR